MARGISSRLFVAIPIMALALAFLSGCNTVEGMGEDIQGAGNWIESQFDDTTE